MSYDLPPLPDATVYAHPSPFYDTSTPCFYTKAQMTEYATAAVLATVERNAAVIEAFSVAGDDLSLSDIAKMLRGYWRPQHDSDCATFNAPAYPAGPCDCSAGENVNERRPETFEELRERIQYIMRLSRACGREPGAVDWEALYQEYVARYGAEANTEKP